MAIDIACLLRLLCGCRALMTVKELRKALDKYPQDMQVGIVGTLPKSAALTFTVCPLVDERVLLVYNAVKPALSAEESE